MGRRGKALPSFKRLMLQLSVVYPACIILRLIILNCSKASRFTWDLKLPPNNGWQCSRRPDFDGDFRILQAWLVNEKPRFKPRVSTREQRGAPGGAGRRCPLRSDYSQTPLLGYLWLSRSTDGALERGEESKNLMMWFIGGKNRDLESATDTQ